MLYHLLRSFSRDLVLISLAGCLTALSYNASAQVTAGDKPAGLLAQRASAPSNQAVPAVPKENQETRTLQDAFRAVERLYNVFIVFREPAIGLLVSETELSASASVETTLGRLLAPHKLTFRKANRVYVVLTTEQARSMSDGQLQELVNAPASVPSSTSAPVNAPAQEQPRSPSTQQESRIIRGKVTDESGQPLVSATVAAVDASTDRSTIGTFTDADGKFELKLPLKGEYLLRVSYVGMKTVELPVREAGDNYNAVLKGELQTEEVVVVGYGAQRRGEVTGSVTTVDMKRTENFPVADAAQALQGQAAGVQVLQNSGAPGGTGGTSIRIRGISSVTGNNNPLVVLDGVPLPADGNGNLFNTINPQDIESMTVLKDGAATAIYGNRAANGVILINTKRGKSGITSFRVDYQRSVQQAWRLPEMLNAREYATINNEARIAANLPLLPKLADPAAVQARFGEGTNWMNEIFRTASMDNFTVSASGGSEKVSFSASFGYYRQDGAIIESDFNRISARVNGDIVVSSRFKISANINFSRTEERGIDTFSPFNSVLILAMQAPPTVTGRNPDGSYSGPSAEDDFGEPNPLPRLEVPDNLFTRTRLIASINWEWELLDGLKWKTNFGSDLQFNRSENFSYRWSSTGGQNQPFTGYSFTSDYIPSVLGETYLTYNRAFGRHDVTAMVGGSAQTFETYYLGASRGNGAIFRDDLPDLGPFSPTALNQIGGYGGGLITNRLAAGFGRLNYDYNKRYLLTVNYRYDGSSRFIDQNRWTSFWGTSVGWRPLLEEWFPKFSWLDELKIRASYGQSANQEIGNFDYLPTIGSVLYSFGGTLTPGATPQSAANPDLQWEANEQYNLGIEAQFLGGRLGTTIEVYRRLSNRLLLGVPVSGITGVPGSQQANVGSMLNYGLDLTITSENIKTPELNWTTSLNVSFVQNEFTDLDIASPFFSGGLRGQFAVLFDEGQPAGSFYGFVTDGIFQTQAEVASHATQTALTAPGDIRFKDLNGDGVINANDRTFIGSPVPDMFFGMTNTITWRKFDLSIFVQGTVGNEIFNFNHFYDEGGLNSNGNSSRRVLDRWTGPGTSNSTPRAVFGDPNQNLRFSDRYVEDGSYLRVKNVTIGYDFASKLKDVGKFNRARLYVGAQNLLTITSYTGMDPEIGGGLDIGFYPQARVFLVGVNLEF
jgi:TonB-dependent starch-binding outer membrane protein SusC